MQASIRDRFFALSAATAPTEEVERYRAEVDQLAAEPTTTIDGLAVCWHPTARFKAVRFVEADRLDEGIRDLFARPSAALPYLAAVFVDPREYSFKTFENILPLDSLFADVPLDVSLVDRERLAPGVQRFAIRLPDEARELLTRLDSLDLYVPPLNAASRGGDRFIFHSALLAEALTAAVRVALPNLMGFSHVNPVFRCNRFEPGDADFHRHLDTPYRDAARRQISRHTMLLYLTGGSGAPALNLLGEGGIAITEIGEFTCVVFDQRYEHEGRPFLDGRKVFLRTELIGAAFDVVEVPEVGALFSKACYLTGESVFAPELAKWADDYYNRVAAAHWNGPDGRTGREPFQYKDFRGVHFVANGYDFWFGSGLSVAECAAITLLDYFNCKVDGEAFRALCTTETIEADGTDWIPGFLAERSGGSAVVPFDKAMLFPEPEGEEVMADGDSTRDNEIAGVYVEAQDFARSYVSPAPILMLGQDIVLDPDRFIVDGGLIHVVGDKPLGRVTFASSDIVDAHHRGVVEEFLRTEIAVDAAYFLVPPIMFRATESGFHLRFDFFRNSWVTRHDQVRVAVPSIRWADPESFSEESPPGSWLRDAGELAVAGDGRTQDGRPAHWWISDRSPAAPVGAWLRSGYDADEYYAEFGDDDDDDEFDDD